MAVYAYLWSDEQGESVDKVQQHGLTCQDWQWLSGAWHQLVLAAFVFGRTVSGRRSSNQK